MIIKAQESGELTAANSLGSDLARLLVFLEGAGYERRDEDVLGRDGCTTSTRGLAQRRDCRLIDTRS